MIQLLFTLLGAEVGVAVALLFKTPLRKLAILGLDRLKRGRGPLMVKTVAATVLVVLASSLYSMAKIRARSADIGSALSPTDQVLMSRHLLEASLMEKALVKLLYNEIATFYNSLESTAEWVKYTCQGYALFLALIIDRLHHYIRELRSLIKHVEVVMKQNRVLEEAKKGGSEDIKAREKEIVNLNAKVKQLELESETRLKEAKAAEANSIALRKQSEGFLLEYDRLLEENQNLRSQLQSVDHSLSRSDSKKNT